MKRKMNINRWRWRWQMLRVRECHLWLCTNRRRSMWRVWSADLSHRHDLTRCHTCSGDSSLSSTAEPCYSCSHWCWQSRTYGSWTRTRTCDPWTRTWDPRTRRRTCGPRTRTMTWSPRTRTCGQRTRTWSGSALFAKCEVFDNFREEFVVQVDKDKDLRPKDKNKDLKIGLRGFWTTRTFFEDNTTQVSVGINLLYKQICAANTLKHNLNFTMSYIDGWVTVMLFWLHGLQSMQPHHADFSQPPLNFGRRTAAAATHFQINCSVLTYHQPVCSPLPDQCR